MKKGNWIVIVILLVCFVFPFFGFANIGGDCTAYAETKTIDIYAINDFHGSVGKMPQIAGYLAARKSTGAVIVNSGDMFQGSLESNSNYGKLLSECMDVAGFDAFTFGNHEFDWGLDNLRTLAQNSKTPFLGANIYEWNPTTRQWGDFADDLAKQYTIVETNELKVGIIGVIGKDQITSISSQLVQNIGFKDPAEVIPDLSNELRGELGCDVVIVSAHTGQDTFLNDYSWDITQYADAVLCAHTHQEESAYKNGVPFIQGGAYGNYVTHVELTVDNGNVSCSTYENIYYSRLSSGDVDNTVKSTVQTKINNSNADIAEEANQVLATLTGGYLNSRTAVPRLVCQAVADYATKQGYEIHLAMVNNARSSLQQGNITYTALYEAIPFDNIVYVAKVSGRDILNEAQYEGNSIWRVSGDAIANSSLQYYTIAVIDYLLYHQNTRREYNYFASAFQSDFTPVALTKQGVESYNYRDITREFLLNAQTIDASTYLTNNVYTDKDQLTTRVTMPGNTETPGQQNPSQQNPNQNTPSAPSKDYTKVLIIVSVVIAVVIILVIVVAVVSKKKSGKK